MACTFREHEPAAGPEHVGERPVDVACLDRVGPAAFQHHLRQQPQRCRAA